MSCTSMTGIVDRVYEMLSNSAPKDFVDKLKQLYDDAADLKTVSGKAANTLALFMFVRVLVKEPVPVKELEGVIVYCRKNLVFLTNQLPEATRQRTNNVLKHGDGTSLVSTSLGDGATPSVAAAAGESSSIEEPGAKRRRSLALRPSDSQ